MGAGADEAGDDLVVGRTNRSGERTVLLASGDDPDGYQEDFVLKIATVGDHVLPRNPEGIDALHATGTVAFPTSGVLGPVPPGNGVVARGANGVVGYVHAVARDRPDEQQVQAGVLGVGGGNSPGLFGRGANGVLGYADGTLRDPAYEAVEPGGVVGLSSTGTGVRGKGDTGVAGEGDAGAGVIGRSGFGPGVAGVGDQGIGVLGESTGGQGLFGLSKTDNGGAFQSERWAQIWLMPRETDPLPPAVPHTPDAVPVGERHPGPALPRAGRAGELTALVDRDGHCTLWLCTGPAPSGHATWAQLLVGAPVEGRV
ncbi:hypothetical protein [Kitasatospora sp. NPDC059571]|uniref:hypothetical protein n=1 Tax=Kitasatospora sp. NPDC059571 TaxID=3346871 RepID=UPI0036B4D784